MNNFNEINNLLKFDNEGEFYLVQIYKRRKDNPGMEKDMFMLDSFFIYSNDDLKKIEERIIKICEDNNARAYIRLNRRSNKAVAGLAVKKSLQYFIDEQYRDVKKAWLSACGEINSEPVKRWVVDIDIKQYRLVAETRCLITGIQSTIKNGPVYSVIKTLETKNGYHIITQPFNIQEFNEKMKDSPYLSIIEIKKDANTLLYVGD